MTFTDLPDLVSLRGHFALESGYHSDTWLELDELFRRPGMLADAIEKLAMRLGRHRLDGVCGPLVGGGFVALLVAKELELEFFYSTRQARKAEGGLYPFPYRMPDASRPAVNGKTIAIVDDVISAGSATRATLSELLTCDARVPVISALATVGETAAEFAKGEDIALETVVTLPNSHWLVESCPLCQEGVPLTTPDS